MLVSLNDYAAGIAKKLRKERKLTLEEMGNVLGQRSTHGYFNIENGKKAITLIDIEIMCKHFDVPVGIFFEKNIDRVSRKRKKKSGQST